MENIGEAINKGQEIKFIPYNTGMPTITLPEYGRTIQNMVDYCVEIPDKEERTACAYAIIGVMRKLFPQLVGEGGSLKKFWDHLNIMSHFELDIEFPCEVITAEQINPKPEKIPYNQKRIHYRQYGRSIEGMVGIIASMEDSAEKDDNIRMVANQMKKFLMAHNPEGVDNARILRDLRDLSESKIDLDPASYALCDFKDITPVKQSKKGKKKKKN